MIHHDFLFFSMGLGGQTPSHDQKGTRATTQTRKNAKFAF
jgi:hypothetical protein